jgi:DNA-binding NtrC family response regulator
MAARDYTSGGPYFDLVPSELADAVTALIEAVRARKAQLFAEWHALCLSSVPHDAALLERLFHDLYIPQLRSAFECLARGDAISFVELARVLGEQVAGSDLPFAAFVAHVNFLKEACARMLADDLAELGRAQVVLDRLSWAIVSISAEGYYRSRPGDGAASNGRQDHAAFTVTPSSIFHGIVGRSSAMRRLFDQIRRVAIASGPVLVLGETGTGKDLIARAIHAAGSRSDGPFVALNCAALPRELIEAELFGYKRGAFSGALSDGPGLFRAATGGTLLLDEIAEMAPELQAKLLRVLQEHTVRPIGSMAEEPIDVRVVALSNRDPARALETGLLRRDLYYRLSVTTLVVPPLRDRRDDIPALVEYHLRQLNQRLADGMSGPRCMASSAMVSLMAHAWPGNVRELFNAVEHAFTMCRGTRIDVADLELVATPRRAMPTDAPERMPTVAEHERSLIEQTLALTGGNKVRAARWLGISRKKLYAKLALYGLIG